MSKKIVPPLMLEDLQNDANMLYLTLLEYKRKNYLVVIDNIRGVDITAFVLDSAHSSSIDLNDFMSISNKWYYTKSERHPLSFTFSKLNMSSQVSPLLKTFKMDYVSRLVGKVFMYNLDANAKVRRRKVNRIPEGIEIVLHKSY